jgi:hypothetical protein
LAPGGCARLASPRKPRPSVSDQLTRTSSKICVGTREIQLYKHLAIAGNVCEPRPKRLSLPRHRDVRITVAVLIYKKRDVVNATDVSLGPV